MLDSIFAAVAPFAQTLGGLWTLHTSTKAVSWDEVVEQDCPVEECAVVNEPEKKKVIGASKFYRILRKDGCKIVGASVNISGEPEHVFKAFRHDRFLYCKIKCKKQSGNRLVTNYVRYDVLNKPYPDGLVILPGV